MKGFAPLFIGLFGIFAFSWFGLILIPNVQLGHLNPQSDEEGTDIYPQPKSGLAERGRQIYVANGCVYCHTQQVRPAYAASDIERKWGERRSAPRDYIFDRPVLLGRTRMGPDLANVGKRAPLEEETPAAAPAPAPATAAPAAPGASPSTSPAAPTVASQSPSASPAAPSAPTPSPAAAVAAASPAASPIAVADSGEPKPYSARWHHQHLYSPSTVVPESIMPSYRFLYTKRRISGTRSADALGLTTGKVAEQFEVVPTYEAECLVAYLMSLDQSHPLDEVKSAGATVAAAAAPAAPAAK